MTIRVLQVLIGRAEEAGRLQRLNNQHNQQSQEQIQAQFQQETIQQQQQVNDLPPAEGMKIEQRQGRGNKEETPRRRRQKGQQQAEEEKEPGKGRHVDIRI
ncbi:MAG: hypothetical protein ACOYD6_01835 [Limnochordia bacterium]|jgi:regulatory protein YycI of two-component signal transduction system YycFG